MTGFINLRDNGPEVISLYDSDGRQLKTIASFSLPQGAPGTEEYPRKVLPPWHLHFSLVSEDRIVYGNSYEYKIFVANSAGDILFKIEKEESPELKPFFDGIAGDSLGNIYVRRLNTGEARSGRVSLDYDLFNQGGRYIYRIHWPFALSLIKNGYAYRIDSASGSGDIKIIRYKIGNWELLKRAITPAS